MTDYLTLLEQLSEGWRAMSAELDRERQAHREVHGILSTARQRVAAAERRAAEALERAELVEQRANAFIYTSPDERVSMLEREVGRLGNLTRIAEDESAELRTELHETRERLATEREAWRAADREAADARRTIERQEAEIAELKQALSRARTAPQPSAEEVGKGAVYWWSQAQRWRCEAELNAANPNWRESVRLGDEVKKLRRILKVIPHGADIEAAQDVLDGLKERIALAQAELDDLTTIRRTA